MNNQYSKFLIYQKDFTESGNDRYFLYSDGAFTEVDSIDIVESKVPLVTHDYWLISSSLFEKHQDLPREIVDVVLLAKIVTGTKGSKKGSQLWDVSTTIKPLYSTPKDFDDYIDMYYRRSPLDLNTYMQFAHKLAEYSEKLVLEAESMNEAKRFFELEVPVFNILVWSACNGIPVSNEIVRKHKETLKWDYYRQLKKFADKHQQLYTQPSELAVREKLSSLGYDIEEYSLDFLIDFLPSKSGYTDDLRDLQKTDRSFRIFNSISSGATKLKPIVEAHWTSTGRIYHKSPNIQNISKKYRDIFIAEKGNSLCYVDYDQFEVGVMAALSKDPNLKKIYMNSDAYLELSKIIFNSDEMRKKAKTLFLSYTYGMSPKNILSSIDALGGDQNAAKQYFSGFSVFEEWKKSIYASFMKNSRIATIFGNHLNRSSEGELSPKESRTAVNHVIQGTATFIFKKALLELAKIEGVQILIPMHDAVLFQHGTQFSPQTAIDIFENSMTSVLSGEVKGKASIEAFF